MNIGKSEITTCLRNDEYVYKDDPRIIFRGKLDSLIALITLIQSVAEFSDASMNKKLEDVRKTVYNIMFAEITDSEFTEDKFISEYGSYEDIHTKSHNIPMLSHDKDFGILYNLLNYLRTQIRETECAATVAQLFHELKFNYMIVSIITALNRLSSVVHIMMYELVELEASL